MIVWCISQSPHRIARGVGRIPSIHPALPPYHIPFTTTSIVQRPQCRTLLPSVHPHIVHSPHIPTLPHLRPPPSSPIKLSSPSKAYPKVSNPNPIFFAGTSKTHGGNKISLQLLCKNATPAYIPEKVSILSLKCAQKLQPRVLRDSSIRDRNLLPSDSCPQVSFISSSILHPSALHPALHPSLPILLPSSSSPSFHQEEIQYIPQKTPQQ